MASEAKPATPARKRKGPSYGRQLFFSLVAALIITIVTVVVVTAAIGPGLDSEELHDLGIDDEARLIEERLEERLEQREETGEDDSGRG